MSWPWERFNFKLTTSCVRRSVMRQSCVPLVRPCRLSSSASWRKAWIHYTEPVSDMPSVSAAVQTHAPLSHCWLRAEVNSHSFVSGRGSVRTPPNARGQFALLPCVFIGFLRARMPIRNYFELCENDEHIDNRKVVRSRFLKERKKTLWHWWELDLRLICGHFSFSRNGFEATQHGITLMWLKFAHSFWKSICIVAWMWTIWALCLG